MSNDDRLIIFLKVYTHTHRHTAGTLIHDAVHMISAWQMWCEAHAHLKLMCSASQQCGDSTSKHGCHPRVQRHIPLSCFARRTWCRW